MSWISFQGEVTLFVINLVSYYSSNYEPDPLQILLPPNKFIGGGKIYILNQSFHLFEIDLWSAICGY
jgi:hypothetical protein